MNRHGNLPVSNIRQRGATLVELLVGVTLSLVVTTSMIALMSNSLGSVSRIIQMSQLTDELRNAMSMMSRDVRRANFNPNSTYCYSNSECTSDGSATQSAGIGVETTDGDTCLTFGLDRNWNGDASDDGGGAFRRDTVTNSAGVSVGVIEMWVGTITPDCSTDTNWMAVTDPEFVDVTTFLIARPFFDESIAGEGGLVVNKRSRQVQMQIQGELIRDRSIFRRIEDTIKVRNDIYL